MGESWTIRRYAGAQARAFARDYAAAVARIGSFLGYRVTVCDARGVCATPQRFPGADEVIVDWPHRYLSAEVDAGRVDSRTVVTVLTHDPKFDVPLLEVALRSPATYIGAMGSRRTHDERLERLRERGLTERAEAEGRQIVAEAMAVADNVRLGAPAAPDHAWMPVSASA